MTASDQPETPLAGAVGNADGFSTPPEGGDTGEQNPDAQSGNQEVRYRHRAKEAEAQRDALAQRVERMQRAEVERLAADALSHPSDLFSLSGNELADYLDEAGEVDADKVAADVAAVLAERPGLRKPTPAFDPSQGLGGQPQPKREPTWGALLK